MTPSQQTRPHLTRLAAFAQARRRACAWALAALASLLAVVPGFAASGPGAGPQAPAVGDHRFFSGGIRLAGADGALWGLGIWATASNVTPSPYHSVYLDLYRCTGFEPMCTRQAGWHVPVSADALQIAPDLSTASLHKTFGGVPITLTLRSTGPAFDGVNAMPDAAIRSFDGAPPAMPSAFVHVSQLNYATETVTFASSTCQLSPEFIGESTGVDTDAEPRPPWNSHTYADVAVPPGISPGLSRGPYGRPHCLGRDAVPASGQRVTVPPGAYTGTLTVPSGATLDVASSLISIDRPRATSSAAMLVKKTGASLLSWQQSLVHIPAWGGMLEPYKGMFYRRTALPAGTYDVAFVSTQGMTAHLFAPARLRVSLRRDSRWHLDRRMADIEPEFQRTTSLSYPFVKTAKSVGLLVATYSMVTHHVLPVDEETQMYCFRLRGQPCDDGAPAFETYGSSFGVYENEPVESDTGEECFGCMDTISNGNAESSLELANNGSKGQLDLWTVVGTWSR